jgi:crossover junction endodeoxyribonuclease RuvC
VENTFINKDGVNSLKLAQARAIALLAPKKFGLNVSEYAPNKIKKTVVGVGHADKQQVVHMVQLQLPGVQLNGPDAADALAIAICHSFHAVSNSRFQQALEKV